MVVLNAKFGKKLMTLAELQKQALQLPTDERWQLVQTLLESLKQETNSVQKKGNLSVLARYCQKYISI